MRKRRTYVETTIPPPAFDGIGGCVFRSAAGAAEAVAWLRAFVDPSKLAINRDAPVADRGAFMDAIRPRIAAMKAMQTGAVARN